MNGQMKAIKQLTSKQILNVFRTGFGDWECHLSSCYFILYCPVFKFREWNFSRQHFPYYDTETERVGKCKYEKCISVYIITMTEYGGNLHTNMLVRVPAIINNKTTKHVQPKN